MSQRRTGVKRASLGFGLLDMLVAMVIMAILASIALPAYTQFTLGANRIAATNVLTQIAQLQERYYSENRTYGSLIDLGYESNAMSFDANGIAVDAADGVYTVTQSLGSSPPSFQVTASAIGTQARDTDCSTLRVTSTGAQSPGDCW